MCASREMNLEEYMLQLLDSHAAVKEYRQLLVQLAAANERADDAEALIVEVYDSIPSTYDETHPEVKRHAAALLALGPIAEAARGGGEGE